MARQIKWTEAAWADLAETAAFIAQDSPYYASSFVREVRDAARSLGTLAERGHIVPELNNRSIRELFVRQYRLLYRVEKDAVHVLAFIHGARDLPALWKKREV